MLKRYLDEAISILDELISITCQDIENIKEAKHSLVDESVKRKTALIRKFEDTKKSLDTELVKLSKVSSNIQEALDEDVKSKLATMRQKLENLNKINKEYSKHIVLVKEFFDSLTKQMFNIDTNFYGKDSLQNSIFKAKV